MPSPEHAADLERVLTRAAREVEGSSVWFGAGLPQALQATMEAAGRKIGGSSPDLAFVDTSELGSTPSAKIAAQRVVAMSVDGLERLQDMVHAAQSSVVPVTRLVCPFAVFDFTRKGLRVREIARGLTAADLQARLDSPLWAGPDLKQLA